jgi:hypothetical protein
MKALWNRLVAGVKEQWSRSRARNDAQKRHEREIDEAIERVVDQVNPRIRAVGGYRKKLFPVVERAVGYLGELVTQVPGPVLVDRRTWSSEPIVNALFGSVDRMRWVLSGPHVRRYRKENPLGGDCYAVFVAMPDIKSQLGVELVGDTLHKDVRQTAVSFMEQEVVLVHDSEEAVRRALAEDALDLLVSFATEHILEQESRISEVEERLRVVRLKLKLAETRTRGAGLMLEDKPGLLQERDAQAARLAELEKDLEREKRGLVTLDDHLDRLVELLAHPETHLGLERQSVRLDRMNIVREGADDETAPEIEFTRGRRGGKLQRVITLVRFPRSEILEDGDRLREVERYLG